jgi:hypothetical protein
MTKAGLAEVRLRQIRMSLRSGGVVADAVEDQHADRPGER